MRMTTEAFEALPEDVQKKARSHLRAFNECLIVFEYGEFQVGGGSCIKAVYAPDHKVYGFVYADDIYTPEERICNYIEAFHDYPLQYKGKRDYDMLREARKMRQKGVDAKVRLVNGNAELPVAGIVCKRCLSPVWRSELSDYSYQCFECEEDLFTFETEPLPVVEAHKPILEGTAEDTGFMGSGYCDEYCSHCEGETFNIPADRVSLCAHCGAELFPCAVCEEGCDWSWETHGCHRFQHTDEWIAMYNATQEAIQPQG